MSKQIYLDYAATTPCDKRVLRQMIPFFDNDFANASSTHGYGQKTLAAVTRARQQIADFFYCQPEEIFFTSGATESDNLAIKGILEYYRIRFAQDNNDSQPHLITTAIEHPAVIESALAMEKKGFALDIIKPDKNGHVHIEDILSVVRDNTVLISVMYINNEIGSIQPVQELGKKIQELNKQRLDTKLPRIYFHSDAVQALSYYNCRPDHLKADLLSFSAHKIFGPKGIGILYIRSKTPIIRQMDGGQQERTIRAGTTNTPAIVGFAKAISLIKEQSEDDLVYIKDLSNFLINELKQINSLEVIALAGDKSPAIINFYCSKYKADELQLKLDMAGYAVSTGSACSSGSNRPSRIIMALGYSEAVAKSCIRISLAKNTKFKDITKLIKELKSIL